MEAVANSTLTYRSFLARKYGRFGGVAMDDLAQHDKQHHPDGYREGDTCKYREQLAKTDEPDAAVRSSDRQGAAKGGEGWRKHLGGKQVSPEMDAVLSTLFSGKDVSDAEIEATPEWQKAVAEEKRIADELERKYGVRQTSEINTPERQQIRANILAAALSPVLTKMAKVEGLPEPYETNEALKDGESYEVERGRKVFLCIGLPAAGKSTTYANPLAKKHKARLCDSDAIKKAFPEFANGYGGNLVHEESTVLNEAILAEAVKNGDNIVYPILGFKPDKLKAAIQKFKDAGYEVNLACKDVPASYAKGRLLVRFLHKGRYLPLKCISKAAWKIGGSFEANKRNADSYVRSVEDAQNPTDRRVESGGKDFL